MRSEVRAFDHVLIIMFENQYRSYVTANPSMRNLARQGIDMANYFGVIHPSQTNYIASIAGELCNVTGDDTPLPLTQRTIADLIEESPERLRWKAYMDSYIPQNQPWTSGMDALPCNRFVSEPADRALCVCMAAETERTRGAKLLGKG